MTQTEQLSPELRAELDAAREQGLDAIVNSIMRTRLDEREIQRRDAMWTGLQARAAFAFPREQERERLRAAALELVQRGVDSSICAASLRGVALLLGLDEQAALEALQATREVP